MGVKSGFVRTQHLAVFLMQDRLYVILSRSSLLCIYLHINFRDSIGNDPGPNERSVLWNSMVHPFLNLTIYGAIWYQGEHLQTKGKLLLGIKYPVKANQEMQTFKGMNKSQKGSPLDTKNTHNHENRRLSLIESLHMQHCSLQGCIRPLAPAKAIFDFQNNQDRLNDPKGNYKKKKIPCPKVTEQTYKQLTRNKNNQGEHLK